MDKARGNDDCANVMPDSQSAADAADRLFGHLECRHLRPDGALVGPDPGVSLNLRFTRFVKSYTRFLPWRDKLYYLQAQFYWIVDNLEFYKLTDDDKYRKNVARCARVVADRQAPEGYWEYPQAEWKGRIPTVEGCFGALSLLEAFEIEQDERFIEGAKRWHRFMVDRIGFQRDGDDALAVNYFNNVSRGMVPNNSTLVLWLEAALSRAAKDERLSEHTAGLIAFLAKRQLDTGELPYIVESEHGPGRVHYLCFQYNAFQFLDLAEYHRISGDDRVLPIMRKLTEFLGEGLTIDGDARHDCESNRPRMHYFTAAVTAALSHASYLSLGDFSQAARRGCERLVLLQRPDGGYDYSLGDYGFLADRRSYPRNQAMMLRHLLICSRGGRLRVEG